MSYLPEANMIALKRNINTLIKNKSIDINELLKDLGISRDVFNKIINIKSNREISPDMFYTIEIYCLTKNIETENLLGPLPEKYGERLKYFIFKHYLTQSDFSKKCRIPSSTLWNMITDKSQIGTKYKDKICIVLKPTEFDLLSSYGDVTIPDITDMNVVNGCNLSWNMYKHASKFFKYDPLIKELKIDSKDKDKFLAGTIKISKPKIRIIAKYLKCDESDLTQDTLNLINIKNRFGYWLASKIYSQNNSIPMFADRCNIDADYLADIIKGECLIKDKDVKNIAIHLGVDPDGLLEICPKTDLDLLPIAEEKMSLNEIVRARISNLGYTFKEFCTVMDVNHNTMATSLHVGRLPKKNRNDIIRELDLQDRFPLDNEEIEVQSVEEQIKEDIEDNKANPIPISTPLELTEESEEKVWNHLVYTDDPDSKISLSSTTTLTANSIEGLLDGDDIENIMSIMDSVDYDHQISLAKFICSITNTIFTDDLNAPTIMGKLSRMNLIKDNL